MQRDFDLIRKLLMFFEEKQSAKHIEVPSIDGYSERAIKYHLVLLYQAGRVAPRLTGTIIEAERCQDGLVLQLLGYS